jgi:hypothetical protein
MLATVHVNAGAEARLASLGLSVAALQDASKGGYLGWASCTPNDPVFVPGDDAVVPNS